MKLRGRDMAKIKICGLTRKEDIDAVNFALPDYIGFVFAKSRRQVDEHKAMALKSHLNPAIKAVGVFVNEDIEKIIRLCKSQIIDVIQLHGDENKEYINTLKSSVPNQIIKAIRIKDHQDLKTDYPCDFLLFDAFHPGQYGGTGKTFDWSIISNVKKPYFLAGGISLENILKVIEQYNPYCIDVSSGVETNGYKDPQKILDIVSLARLL